MIGQLIIEGLAIGACYGLFAIAVVIIYKTSEVVNFAQGEMAMLSTFIAFHILNYYHYPFWLAFILTMAFAILLGVLIEFLFLRPAKHPSLLGLIVITLGAEMLLMGLAGWKWGAEQKEFVVPMSYQVTHEPFQGMIINDWAIAVFVTSALVMVLLFLFFKYTKLGIAMRATQQNKHAAKIMGIRVERVFSIAWGFSSLIGTIAAMFFASRSTLDPGFMLEPFLRAFAAAVLGGLMSIPGVFIGGELLGLIENFFGYVWPEWKPIVAFAVIVLVLCFRPSGLFAKHYVKKV
ncbi:MAG: branched-chain amino acid ABC transporter permease [Syntrophales bacterium]|jgi:branched-chain amino acid transport system permease protein|nr:branched-chain amino acid ABC transporter permease [Syntrophales bacterium]MDD2303020.1 branched-chain amino acid ABC transporter permease [Eubacteriales bacterium]MDD4339818.1 branched-chain amino acid ABC transporter permease [Syntrophales bacterium]HOG07295.1 branched-chain amino acid ABC transporter permease [Syntrophales bacterium]HPB70859.1 branched-chain amino acid ABC transporter permease [Syntrophales bacterium]